MSATDFVFDKFVRCCDICGRPRKGSEMTLRDGVAICFTHPGFRTAKELDKLNARRKIPIAPLPKNTQPFAPLQTWEAEEARVFDLVVTVAPFETYDNTSDGAPGITGPKSVTAAGWAGIYLYAVIAENKRPALVIARARTKIVELGDYLISVQITSTGGATSLLTGTFGTSPWLSADLGVACLTLLRCYQLTGATKYLDAAKLGVGAIVNFQAMNLVFTSPDPVLYGPPTHSVVFGGNYYDHLFYPSDLTCLWAEKLLFSLVGDGTYGRTDTSAGFWTAAPARLLSTSMAQIQGFWTTGVAGVNGLSAATPWEFFHTNGAGWNLSGSDNVTTANWAAGLRSLYEVSGSTAQLTGCMNYLLALGQGAATKVPAGYSPKRIQDGILGTFDPKTAPANSFDPVSATGSGGLYDFASAGLLAPLATRASVDAAKEAVGTLRPRTKEGTPRDGRWQSLGRLGMSGYSFQPFAPDSTHRQESVTRAAQVGLLYRQNMTGMGSH